MVWESLLLEVIVNPGGRSGMQKPRNKDNQSILGTKRKPVINTRQGESDRRKKNFKLETCPVKFYRKKKKD